MSGNGGSIDEALANPVVGWWLTAVLDAFGYLVDDFGYLVAQVSDHFRGSYVVFSGSVLDLVIEHDPEDSGHVHADLVVHADLRPGVAHPRFLDVNDVLHSREPDLVLPDRRRHNLSRDQTIAAVTVWAEGLQRLAPDVLRGELPTGIAPGALW